MRFRNAILGIFEEILPREDPSREISVTRRTKVSPLQLHGDTILATGGLRVEATGKVILVEVDRNGGIMHLMQCWHFLARHLKEAYMQISLFYICLVRSPIAADTYQSLWDFGKEQAQRACGDRLQAHSATCRRPDILDPHGSIPGPVVEQCRARLRDQGILGAFARTLDEILGPANVNAPREGISHVRPRVPSDTTD